MPIKGDIWAPGVVASGVPSDVGAGKRVGILALQGGVGEHARMLKGLGATVSYLRKPADLVGPDGLRVDALVLPGGESSTMDRLLRIFDLFEPLRDAIASGLPTLGTCAGLILLAHEVMDPAPGQRSLGVLDVAVQRNAFGSQVDSAEVLLETKLGPANVAFIRAPKVVAVGEGVEVLARRGAWLRQAQPAEGAQAQPAEGAQAQPAGAVQAQSAGCGPVLGLVERAWLRQAQPAEGIQAQPSGSAVSGAIVAVRQGNITGLAFHPELTDEPLFHAALLGASES